MDQDKKAKLNIIKWMLLSTDDLREQIQKFQFTVLHVLEAGCAGFHVWAEAPIRYKRVFIGTPKDIHGLCKKYMIKMASQPYLYATVSESSAKLAAGEIVSGLMNDLFLEYIAEQTFHLYEEDEKPERFRDWVLGTPLHTIMNNYVLNTIIWASANKNVPSQYHSDKWVINWTGFPTENLPSRGGKLPTSSESKTKKQPLKKKEILVKPTSEEAEKLFLEGMEIFKTKATNRTKLSKASELFDSATSAFLSLEEYRKAAISAVFAAEAALLLGGNLNEIKTLIKFAKSYLDENLDTKEMIICKSFEIYIEEEEKKSIGIYVDDGVEKKAEIYRTAPKHATGFLSSIPFEGSMLALRMYVENTFGGGAYDIKILAVDPKFQHPTRVIRREKLVFPGEPKIIGTQIPPVAQKTQATPQNEKKTYKHLLLNKPEIVQIVKDFEEKNNIPKKRPEAKKQILQKASAKKQEIDFVKAAVFGGLFKDDIEEPE